MIFFGRRINLRKLLIFAGIGGIVGFVLFNFNTDHLTSFIEQFGVFVFISVGLLLGIFVSVLQDFLYFGVNDFILGFSLKSMSVSVPKFSELNFVINNHHRKVAWALFVETITRITTQPLDGDGLLREAFSSLYGLFTTTREILKTVEPTKTIDGTSVEMFAISMLNLELRPFLSRWHPRLREFEEQNPGAPENNWGDNEACRKELERLRLDLLEYAKGFGELAGVQKLDDYFFEDI